MKADPVEKTNQWTTNQVVLATLFVVCVFLSFWLLFRFRVVVFLFLIAIVIGTTIRRRWSGYINMKTTSHKLTLDEQATYQIQAPGKLDTRGSDWAEEMAISIESNHDGMPVTTIIGSFDQAALLGLLRRLYSLGLPLISVRLIESD